MDCPTQAVFPAAPAPLSPDRLRAAIVASRPPDTRQADCQEKRPMMKTFALASLALCLAGAPTLAFAEDA